MGKCGLKQWYSMPGSSITQEVWQLEISSPDPRSDDPDQGEGVRGGDLPQPLPPCVLCTLLFTCTGLSKASCLSPFSCHSSTLSSYHSRHLGRWLKCTGLSVTVKCQDTSPRANEKLPLRKVSPSLRPPGLRQEAHFDLEPGLDG